MQTTSPSTLDAELVSQARSGDDSAFTELVGRHKRRVFGLASRFTQDASQLDELAQETFIRAWQQLGKFRNEAPFEHWLVRIAVHVCYDFLRQKRSRQGRESFSLDDSAHDSLELAAEPTETMAAETAREIVENALAKLKPDERLVLTLLEMEEKSVHEIAEMTGWSESNVKVRAFRAREAFKKLFKNQP